MFTMQKRCNLRGSSGRPQLTGIAGAAYSNSYDSLTRHRGYVLLLPDAGAWVGTSEILPTHPAKAGGFYFHPLL